MTDRTTREIILDYLAAFYSGDVERALSFCTDDVDFLSYAPVDLLPHLGHRRGKQQLAETWTTLHQRYSSMRYEVPLLIAEGERAACIIRAKYQKSARDRVVQMDLGDFYQLRGGRIAQVRQFMDSFNAVEQVFERDLSSLLTQLKQ